MGGGLILISFFIYQNALLKTIKLKVVFRRRQNFGVRLKTVVSDSGRMYECDTW